MSASAPQTLSTAAVQSMFDRVSRYYDPVNTLMSAGLHNVWRRRAADYARVEPGDRVLDVAAGTGDLTIELSRRTGSSAEVIGCDVSEGMLALARQKAPALRFETADALALPYASDSFDAATVGFGARNFSDLDRGLRELVRVVRPGGRVVVLEFTNPTREPLRSFFRVWFNRIVPMIGRLAGQSDAYHYLARSVRRFPSPPELAESLAAAGLADVHGLLTGGGIVAIHAGTVGPPEAS